MSGEYTAVGLMELGADLLAESLDEAAKRFSENLIRYGGAWHDEVRALKGEIAELSALLAEKVAVTASDHAEMYLYLRDRTTGEGGTPGCFLDTGYGEGFPRIEGEALDAAIRRQMRQA